MFLPNLKKIIAKKPKILNLFQLGRGFSPFPLFYLVHLTLACNARCRFCYQKDLGFDVSRNEFLKIGDFEKILKQAKSFLFRKPLIYFFGGEPLLHPQFAEFLELTEKYHFPCALTTNGILLGKYLDEIAAADNLSQINVSLYGTGEVHDKIAGRSGIFDEAIFSIRRLQESSRRKKIININCVINETNFDKSAVFAGFLDRYFKNRELDALIFQYPMQKEICRKIDNPVFKAEIEKLEKMKFSFHIYFTSEKWFNDCRTTESSFFRGNCNLPWLGLGILPNLDIMPGGSVLACTEVLGNLRKNSLREVWSSGALRDFRSRILKRGLSPACRGCCHAQIN